MKRAEAALVMSPKLDELKIACDPDVLTVSDVLGGLKLVWFSALNASARSCRATLSRSLKLRATERSRLK
jgi:hypothetical protein